MSIAKDIIYTSLQYVSTNAAQKVGYVSVDGKQYTMKSVHLDISQYSLTLSGIFVSPVGGIIDKIGFIIYDANNIAMLDIETTVGGNEWSVAPGNEYHVSLSVKWSYSF